MQVLPLPLLESLADAEGDKGADAEARRVPLTVEQKEGGDEREGDAENKVDPLVEIDADSESRKEDVGSAAVAVAALEALPSEAEGVSV